MKPETVHLIAQDIRHRRGYLSKRDEWFRKQEPSEMRSEGFREINFWRWVYTMAEEALATGKYKIKSGEDDRSLKGCQLAPRSPMVGNAARAPEDAPHSLRSHVHGNQREQDQF